MHQFKTQSGVNMQSGVSMLPFMGDDEDILFINTGSLPSPLREPGYKARPSQEIAKTHPRVDVAF